MSINQSPETPGPAIVIYQQPDHVAGLLQQLYGEGLVVSRVREATGENESAAASTKGASGGIDGAVKAPLLGQVGAKASGTFDSSESGRNLQGNRSSWEYVFSQSYYLYLVRARLQEAGLITKVTNLASAKRLRPGDFVEFEATFQPDQLAAALDILRPDLVAQLTRKLRIRNWVKSDVGSYEEMQTNLTKFKENLEAEVSLAAVLADAVRVDFRSEKTREYYGDIGGRVTAVTICDAEHFTVEDEDRILDGRFTVLGKVTDALRTDRPILERNKLLNKIAPEFVDEMVRTMNNALNSHGNDAVDRVSDDVAPLNLKVESRIPGKSLKVVPIAIYT